MRAPRPRTPALVAALVIALVAASTASAQALRLAAPPDCSTNPGCAVGLAQTYGINVDPSLVALSDPDGGIGALDDRLAEVAVVFSTDPDAGRTDLVRLKDDRDMLGSEALLPVFRTATIKRFAPADQKLLRARVRLTGALLTTRDLRGMNQLVRDGRIPEAIAGEWVEGKGLTSVERQPAVRPGPRILIGNEAFDESRLIAETYAEALRGVGFRVTVVDVHGYRPEIVTAFTRRRINASIDYASSLLRYVSPKATAKSLPAIRRALAPPLAGKGLEALSPAQAADTNTFMMVRSFAAALGITRLSDLRGHFPAATK
jgi:hypothetical protein